MGENVAKLARLISKEAKAKARGNGPAAFERMILRALEFCERLAIARRESQHKLEKRVANLEARPAVKFGGVYRPNQKVSEAELKVHGGSLWIAKRNTSARPGSGSDWQLVCKRGDFDGTR